LHFRIDIHAFIDGDVVIAQTGQQSTIKCQTKVEVYPGQDSLDQCRKVLEVAMKKVETNDLKTVNEDSTNRSE
ncbi:MAG: hypothetical protein QF364_07325, partial [Candidatus Poseidoniaceae archaeon]|nr:hypothetical protein [Candidatus Poseidoniaceae archaeon]